MQVQHHDHTTAAGTVTGTVFTVAANIDSQDYLRTAILACVGAIASFVISIVLKWIWNRFTGKERSRRYRLVFESIAFSGCGRF